MTRIHSAGVSDVNCAERTNLVPITEEAENTKQDVVHPESKHDISTAGLHHLRQKGNTKTTKSLQTLACF